MRLRKDFNPVGTSQLIRLQLRGQFTWHKYTVLEVTGGKINMPNEGNPVIWMELAEKNGGTFQQFISLPLSVFGQRVLPLTEGDKFWEEVKSEMD